MPRQTRWYLGLPHSSVRLQAVQMAESGTCALQEQVELTLELDQDTQLELDSGLKLEVAWHARSF